MLRKLFLAILTLSLIHPAAFGAETTEENLSAFRLSGTGHLLVANRNDPNDATLPATNRMYHELSLTGQYANYSLNLHWSNRIGLDKYSSGNNASFTMEKVVGKAQWGDFDLIVGDSYQEIGRGIALSLYRDDVFGIDNTVQGAAARFHPAGWDANVFAGRINSFKSPVAINPVDNTLLRRTVLLAGSTVAHDFSADSKIEGHYFVAAEVPFSQPVDAVWQTAGLIYSQDGILEGVDVYAESNVLFTRSIINGRGTDLPTGFGSYGSLVYSPAPVKIKLEVKDYRQDNFEFRRPPTLEEDIVLTTDVVNVSGGRLLVENRFDENNSVFTSFLMAEDRILGGVLKHGVVGGKWRLPGKISLETRGGYRWAEGIENMSHASLKIKVPTFKGQAVEASALIQYYNQRLNADPTPNNRHIFGTTYNFSESFNAGLGYEYVPTNSDNLGRNFVNAGATYKTGPYLARAFVGQTSGGTVCSGGVCRVVPPFTGAYLEGTYSY